MKFYNFAHFSLVCLLITFGMTGCETIKTHGVYTTLAFSSSDLDMPASGYMQKSSFGPGETPAAVVVGYGTYNRQQLIRLELIESSTGHSLFSRDYYASYGKALMQPLPIRRSGDYEFRLMADGTELDTCQFTVTRTNTPGTTVRSARSLEKLEKLALAVQSYSCDHILHGQPLPSSVTLDVLAAGGYISAKSVRDFVGVDVTLYPTASDSKPQAILVRARRPDGVQIEVLADGSMIQLPK